MEKVGAYTDRVTESGEWRTGNPAAGQQATPMLAAYFNMLQRELTAIVEGADIELDAEDDAQLLAAINILIDRKVPDQQILSFSTSTTLTANQMGLILIDASAGELAISLPPSAPELGIRDIILHRVDNSAHRAVIQGDGSDRILFSTDLRSDGYSFFPLMGAGDYWHLRSDAAGRWHVIQRRDSTPLGVYVDGSGLRIPPGGYGIATGTVLAAHYPWLKDFALQSGALCAVSARTAREGRWSISDDGLTVHLPSPGSAFRRSHDPAGARNLGTHQGDAIRNITGSFGPNATNNSAAAQSANGAFALGGGTEGRAASDGTSRTYSFDASRVVPTAAENRPENITFYPLMKLI